MQKTISPRGWALMSVLALIWGGSFLANRIALEQVGVMTTVAFRVGVSGLVLWLWILIRGLKVPPLRRFIAVSFGMGVVNNIIPFTLIVWGQQHIESGLAAILNASTAIFTVLLAAAIHADEKLTPARIFGTVVGFVGVAIAIGIEALAHFDLTSLGQLAILGASVAYAVSAVFARVAFKGIRAEVSAAGMLSASAVIMIPLALWTDGLPDAGWTPETWGALCYLALFSSALAYMIYYNVLEAAGAGNMSLVTLMVAPVAIIFGAIVYNEKLAAAEFAGFGLLVVGLLIVDGRLGPRRRVKN